MKISRAYGEAFQNFSNYELLPYRRPNFYIDTPSFLPNYPNRRKKKLRRPSNYIYKTMGTPLNRETVSSTRYDQDFYNRGPINFNWSRRNRGRWSFSISSAAIVFTCRKYNYVWASTKNKKKKKCCIQENL